MLTYIQLPFLIDTSQLSGANLLSRCFKRWETGSDDQSHSTVDIVEMETRSPYPCPPTS